MEIGVLQCIDDNRNIYTFLPYVQDKALSHSLSLSPECCRKERANLKKNGLVCKVKKKLTVKCAVYTVERGNGKVEHRAAQSWPPATERKYVCRTVFVNSFRQ